MQVENDTVTPAENRASAIASVIGNTPLLAVELRFRGKPRTIYAKAEYLNMTGSIKDRMAFHIIRRGYERGTLRPGATIVEATSGNTGISFAAIGRALGHQVTIYMPDWVSDERKNLIRSLGATVRLVSREQGGLVGSIQLSRQAAADTEGAFLPSQFSSADNVEAHYNSTGPELWWQLRFRSLLPDAFVAGVGTGGTVMGVGRFLKKKHPTARLFALEAADSPTLSSGDTCGTHRIEGISDGFIPDILDLTEMDGIVAVDDGDAIIMAQKLAAELGLGVGISSGANLLGALKVQDQLGGDSVVVTIFADDNKKYLTTDLFRDEPVKPGYLSSDVELVAYRAHKRVCFTDCDPVECVETQPPDSRADASLPHCPRRRTS